MPALSAYAQKAALDWLFRGATPTRPATVWLGLSSGTPNSTAGSECTGASGYTRAPVTFSPAVSPGGSAINSVAVTFTVATYASTLRGWQLWDTNVLGSGNMLWYGLLSAATLPSSASAFAFVAGSILLTLL